MTLSTTPAVVQRYVAFELRSLRKRAGVSQNEAAKRIDAGQTKITHLETARYLPRLTDVELLLPLYGASERVREFQDLINHARVTRPPFELDNEVELPRGFDLYVGLEQGAAGLVAYQCLVVDGLLQRPAYAEALIRGNDRTLSDTEVARQVDLRMRRQEAFKRPHEPLDVRVLMEEAVLYRVVGDKSVLADQLEHLLALVERPNVAIRILPTSVGAHPGLHGTFTLLRFPIERDHGVVWVEDLSGGRALDQLADIDRYAGVAERVRRLALPEQASVAVIKRRWGLLR
jgi:transcriptional regulator with XRE-family HTH domain